MKRVLSWIGSAKSKGAGFSFLSVGNILIAFFTYLRFAEIAQIFGTSWQTDAVAIAMVIPLLLQQLISTAFGSAFMPIYSRVMRDRGNNAANLLINRIISWMSLSGVFLIGLFFFYGSTVVRIVGPGIEQTTSFLAVELLSIFLPLIFLNSIEGVLQNFLIYGKRYGLVSFVRVLQILVSYIVLLLGHESLGIKIIPVSGLAGAFVSFVVCAAVSFRLRLRLHPVFDPRDRDFRDLVKLAIPISIGVLTGFLGPVADKVLASFLRTSSVTAIDYASRIKNLIRIVLIQPVIVLSTVSFSRIAAEGNFPRLKAEIASFIKYISYYTVPVSGILVVLSAPLISILFQRGSFGPEQSRYVGYALAFYSPWFAQFGIGLIMRRAFFSMKESVIPAVLGIWAMLANILLNIILLQSLGIRGLALATTLTSAAKTLFLMYFLRKRLGGINGSDFIPEYLKILTGTAVMMGYLIFSGMVFPIDLNAALVDRIFYLALSIVPGIVLYVTVTALLGSKMYRTYSDIIKRKLFPGRNKPPV
ncbi:MAG: polysaccharide biosynthesis C-terminal domain-containing protein [Candidatus Aegiribacteria sp.]|nr:polysaccharide biosynthesis C-terminal domain-containing protein [Candidatus Aegiribacteria sp.]